MSQKELNYIEDIYNHEKLLINIIYDCIEHIDIKDCINLLEKHNSVHDNNMKKIEKLLGDNCG